MSYSQKIIITFSLLLLPFLLPAQFPTTVGTKWEYFQFFEDALVTPAIIPAFRDEIVGDSTMAGHTYQMVRRIGTMYNGIGPTSAYDTLDGMYFYRVQGSQVWVLDTVINGNAQESLLYEFGLGQGATLQGQVKNLVNLTPRGRSPYYLKYYDIDSAYNFFGFIDTVFVRDTVLGYGNWNYGAHTWGSHNNIEFLPNVGTTYSYPYAVVLDIYGQYYYLKRLTVDGLVIYENPGLSTAIELPKDAFLCIVSPNPASEDLNIRSDVPLESVKIIDALGKVVYDMPVNFLQAMTVKVGHLPRGVYWLNARGGDRMISRRVALQ
jgi:hypothetical protein